MKEYTWYVNMLGQVQIYEGNINESLISDACTLEEAMKDQSIKHEHRRQVLKRKGLFSIGYESKWEVYRVTYEERPQIKYWIPQEYAETFFTCIGEINQPIMTYGVTMVNISEFLD